MMYTPTGTAEKFFKLRYQFNEEEDWQGMSRRAAKQVALAELPNKALKYENKFFDVISENLFVPGGRILANSGKINPQLLNCFVLAHELDSKEGWGGVAMEMIITSMTGGGCGIDFSSVRPRGAEIAGKKGAAPGAVELMYLIDGCAAPIRAGGDRRVALMFSLDLDHPDVMEFLDAKLVNGKLTNANVSVRSKRTTEFVKAVKEDLDWELSWKGRYKKTIKARTVWDKIVKNAHFCAEPGFLNWELALSESTIWYIMELVTCNPCGEIGMPSYDACDLGHLVLHRFVNDKGKVNWGLLADTIRIGVRFLDNVLDVNSYPLPEMKEMCSKLRRIGLGTTGLADMLILLDFRYGSKEANKFVDKLYRFISKQAYEASIMLAVEKGPFEKIDIVKHLQSGYVKRLPHKQRSLMSEHGIRNCALLTQAPVGTGSLVSNCGSSLEPLFPACERNYNAEGKRATELIIHPLLEKYLKEGKDTSHFVGANELTIREHMEVQKVVQKHIDNAVSKTINMSEFYPVEDMSKTWLEYLPFLKGTTFYRENSRKDYDEQGNELPPPIVPLSIEEAMKKKKNKLALIDSVSLEECPTGVCKI